MTLLLPQGPGDARHDEVGLGPTYVEGWAVVSVAPSAWTAALVLLPAEE